MRRLTLLFLAPLLVLATPSYAEKRIALVIGNADYRHVTRLNNAVNDANRIAQELQLAQFELITRLNADLAAMSDGVDEFIDRLKASPDAVGVFYYAGHGIQLENRNYLVPVNASGRDERDLMPFDLTRFEDLGTAANIIILDACRNNPFAKTRDMAAATSIAESRGLARLEVPKRSPMLIAYATRPGDVATDGTGSNGPYAAALAKFMQVEGLPLSAMFMQVREQVLSATGHAQEPWESSSLIKEFYFRGGPAARKDVACKDEPGPYQVVKVADNDVLNIRAQAGDKSRVVGAIPPDARGVRMGSCEGSWCRVSYQCQEGWVLSSYLKYVPPVATFERDQTSVSQGLFRVIDVANDDPGLNIRREPKADAEKSGLIPRNGTNVNVGECNGEADIKKRWCVVTYLGVVGWARASYLLKMDYDEKHPE